MKRSLAIFASAILSLALLAGLSSCLPFLFDRERVDPDSVGTVLSLMRGEAPAGAILVDGIEPPWGEGGLVEYRVSDLFEVVLSCVVAPEGKSFSSWRVSVHGVMEWSANNPLSVSLYKTSAEIRPEFVDIGASPSVVGRKGPLSLPGLDLR